MQYATDKSSGELCPCEGRLGGRGDAGQGEVGGRVTSSSSWLRLKHHLRTDVACREPLRAERGRGLAKQGDRGGERGGNRVVVEGGKGILPDAFWRVIMARRSERIYASLHLRHYRGMIAYLRAWLRKLEIRECLLSLERSRGCSRVRVKIFFFFSSTLVRLDSCRNRIWKVVS